MGLAPNPRKEERVNRRAAEDASGNPIVAVAIVGICGAAHLRRCLEALAIQVDCDPFRIVVAYDPQLEGMESLIADFPDVQISSSEAQRTPLELAARAIQQCPNHPKGKEQDDRELIILLTEDHCIPPPDWVARMSAALKPGRAAVGGMVKPLDDCSAVDWAFYFVDFFRYAPYRKLAGSDFEMPSLTVCNVAYRYSQLEEIASLWSESFHETAVHTRLRKFGELWMTPDSYVVMGRSVQLKEAIRERYAFGRLFGCTRPQFAGGQWRPIGVLTGWLLPFVLMTRMVRSAFAAPESRSRLLRSLGPLTLMVLAWSWGEWLGYLTLRPPADLSVAQERDTE